MGASARQEVRVYGQELRGSAGGVLRDGGRILADLVSAARERGVEVAPPLMHLEPGLDADEVGLVLELARHIEVAGRDELVAFLRAQGACEMVATPVTAGAWIEEALAYYGGRGFFAGGWPESVREELDLPAEDQLIDPDEHLEGSLVALDRYRVVALPRYPTSLRESAVGFVEHLEQVTRGMFRLAIIDSVARQDDDAHRRRAPMGEDHVEIEVSLDGVRARLDFHWESKYSLRVDHALSDLNRVIAKSGFAFWFCETAGVALMTALEAERLQRDRGLVWLDPARTTC